MADMKKVYDDLIVINLYIYLFYLPGRFRVLFVSAPELRIDSCDSGIQSLPELRLQKKHHLQNH